MSLKNKFLATVGYFYYSGSNPTQPTSQPNPWTTMVLSQRGASAAVLHSAFGSQSAVKMATSRLAGDVLLGRAVFRLPALPARRPRAHVLPLRLADDCQAIAELGRGDRSQLHGTLQSSRRRRHTARVPGGRPVATAGRPRPGDGRAAGRRRRRTVQVPRGGAPRNHGRGRAGAAETAGGSDVADASLTGAGHRAITGPDPGECGSGAGPPWVDHGPQGGQRAGPGK